MSFITDWLSRRAVETFGKSDVFINLYVLYLYLGFEQHHSNDRPQYIIRFFRILFQLVPYYCLIGFIVIAYQLSDDSQKSLRNLSYAIFAVSLVFRIIMGRAKQQDIETVLLSLSNNLYLNNFADSEENLALQRRSRRALINVFWAFGLICFFGNTFRVVCSGMDKLLLLPMLFYNPEYSVVLSVVECLAIHYYVLWYLLHEMIAFGIFIRVRENYVILHRNIETDGNALAEYAKTLEWAKHSKTTARGVANSLINKTAFEFLRKNIVHHQEILKVIRKLDDFYWLPSLINIFGFGGLFLISYFEFSMLVGVRSWPYPVVEVLYALVSFFEISTKCVSGNQIKMAIQAAAEALYASPWTEMNPSNRKTLKLFQLALQQKSKIIEGRVFGFDHEFLTSFYRSMYGYVAFVRYMAKKG